MHIETGLISCDTDQSGQKSFGTMSGKSGITHLTDGSMEMDVLRKNRLLSVLVFICLIAIVIEGIFYLRLSSELQELKSTKAPESVFSFHNLPESLPEEWDPWEKHSDYLKDYSRSE